MSTVFSFALFSLCLICLFVRSSDAISCYTCNTAAGQGCGNPFVSTVATVITANTNPAVGALGTCGACSTTRTNVAGVIFFQRGCFVDKTTYGQCEATGCISTCTTALCNTDAAAGASSLHPFRHGSVALALALTLLTSYSTLL